MYRYYKQKKKRHIEKASSLLLPIARPSILDERPDRFDGLIVQPELRGFYVLLHLTEGNVRTTNRYGEVLSSLNFLIRHNIRYDTEKEGLDKSVLEGVVVSVGKDGSIRSWDLSIDKLKKKNYKIFITTILTTGGSVTPPIRAIRTIRHLIEQKILYSIDTTKIQISAIETATSPSACSVKWEELTSRVRDSSDPYFYIGGIRIRDATDPNKIPAVYTLHSDFIYDLRYNRQFKRISGNCSIRNYNSRYIYCSINFFTNLIKRIEIVYAECDIYLYICSFDKTILQFRHKLQHKL
jgi:hypothetical protein